MKKSYLSNFCLIYFWKMISVSLGFFSIFIVIPKISSEPKIYGIYMICVSFALFLSYADIGFVRAGFKFCAERFAQNDLTGEMKIQGFVNFILFLFVCPIALVFILLSFAPEFLINDIGTGIEKSIASKLLIIQGLFSFSIVLGRLNNTAYDIRLEGHTFQKIKIVGELLRIASVFYFFSETSYDIVGFFLFSKIIEFCSQLIGFLGTRIKYGYRARTLIKYFRFSRLVFVRTKSLALGTFFATIMAFFFLELDAIAISLLIGPEAVATFAIGLILFSFFRSLLVILYTPIRARFNHFIGLKDEFALKEIYLNTMQRTMPIVFLPVLSMVILMRPLILSWVGVNYDGSIIVAQMLIVSYALAFIYRPTRILIVAQEKIKQLYLLNIIMVSVYWIGIGFTFRHMGINAFALFKMISMIILQVIAFYIGLKFLKTDMVSFFKKIILPFSIPVVVQVAVLMLILPCLPTAKGKLNFITVVSAGILACTISLIVYYCSSFEFRNYIHLIAGRFSWKKFYLIFKG